MICPMVPFAVTLSDPHRRFQGHGDALDEFCAQLTRDLLAIVVPNQTPWQFNSLI